MKNSSLAWVILTAFAGCGSNRPETVAVAGRVTLAGQPAAECRVTFHPLDGRRVAFGLTDAEGRYVLRTFESGDGAMPGEHRVTIYQVTMNLPGGGPKSLADEVNFDWSKLAAESPSRPVVPEIFGNRETTPLSATIFEPTDSLDFELANRR